MGTPTATIPAWLAKKHPRIPMTPSPDGLEIITRGEGSDQIRIIINHNASNVVYEEKTIAPFECIIQQSLQ